MSTSTVFNGRLSVTSKSDAEKMFKVMLETQDNLNRKAAGESWAERANKGELDYPLACSQEICEFHDAYDQYKWWTKRRVDLANVRTELIDALHFGLSIDIARAQSYEPGVGQILLRTTKELSEYYAERALTVYSETVERNVRDMIFYGKQIQISLLASEHFSLLSFFKLVRHAGGMSIEHLFARYIGKSILNHFRQENGYKEGTYFKQWQPNREDNYFLAAFIDNNFEQKNGAEITEVNIREFLTTSYEEVVANTRKHTNAT